MSSSSPNASVLLIRLCGQSSHSHSSYFVPDQSGIVAAVSGFIHENAGNIVHLDQHVDAAVNVFLCGWNGN
ncbi:MAG: hypothetical protein R3F31_09765 [Verrucomicrobiales bacterium]